MKHIIFSLLTLFCSLSSFAQSGRRLEILFLGDNGHHNPIDRVPSLMAALGPDGINFTYTDNLNDLNAETLSKFDALMIYANWDEISAPQEKALLDFVASGKGFLPIHCASYCFRNSQEYIKLVGGQFWRHTMDSVRTTTTDADHPIMKGLSSFTAYDETYLHSQLQADNHILAEREIKADQATDKPGVKTEPYTWTRTYGKGRIFYTAYGHDERTWQQPGFQKLILNAIRWSVNDEALAAYQARQPKPFEYAEARLPNYEQRPGKQLEQKPLSPEESMKHIQVPVDFSLELFAAEPNVQHPIAMSWDEKGKLYVLITKDYPNERKVTGGSDYILVCEDTNGDGKADKFTRFAEGLSIPTGMVFANGGLIVAQAPDMLFLKDVDGDGKADVKKVLFTGFGTFDTHAGPSNLHYGFDNWVWGCVGYSGFKGKLAEGDSLKFYQAFFRFKPDGTKMEWMTTTSNNTWGFGFNETNEVFGSTANNSHGWYMAIPHRYFNSVNRVENGSRSTDTHRDMKPITEKVRQVDAFGGFTAAAGYNFYTARAFPKKYWNQVAFVAEPTGHILHQNTMVKKGTDFYDAESFNLMAGADEWFSPVFAEVGPDGAVWVADWYSYIIQHNPVPSGFSNGAGNAYETDLRDFTHGRIYRVAYKNAAPYQPLSLSMNDRKGLLAALQSDNLFWRMHAQRLLVERGQKDVVPDLIEILKNQQSDALGINPSAIHALWTLEGLNALNADIIYIGLNHSAPEVVRNTIKVMPENAWSVEQIVERKLLSHTDPLVVLNSLLLFSKSPLDSRAEAAFFDRLRNATDADDRWLPDAFSCVLTANGGKLLKQQLQYEASKAAGNSAVKKSSHDHHSMQAAKPATPTKGVDLVVARINVTPEAPSVRERIIVTIEVKNQGLTDLKPGVFVPLNIRFEGNGIRRDVTSRNFNEGIAAGKTALITKSINGPWVGDISFSAEVAGNYELTAAIDRQNEITENNKTNNQLTTSITYSMPPSMGAFALERGIRSYASVAPADSLVKIMRKAHAAGNVRLIQVIAEGWNYDRKNIVLSKADQQWLTTVLKPADDRLLKLMEAWSVKTAAPIVQSRQIRIRAVKEAMKFDITEFTVKPGEQIELVFENPDAMQHNVVIVKPNAREKVGLAADKMLNDPKGAEKNYVPAMTEVLFSTPLIDPGQRFVLRFKAPTQTGDYPFICTFPAHWRLMGGMMKVK